MVVMIVKGIGDSGGLDESTGRTESLLEVVELDELEREAELETIEDTEEPDIIREVNKAVGIGENGGLVGVRYVPEDNVAKELLFGSLLLDSSGTG